MKRLVKIIFVQWYLFDKVEIPVFGHTAIIGGNGAGKSSIIDGVQVVLTGVDKSKISLNKGSNERSKRTIREYCLGYVSDPNGQSPIKPRDRANSYIVLCFYDDEKGEHICAGTSLWATAIDHSERVEGCFITRGDILVADDFTDTTRDGVISLPWPQVRDRLIRKYPMHEQRSESRLILSNKGPGDFRRQFFTMMSANPGLPMDQQTAIKAILSAIAFAPINDPTKFVRENMLEHEDINIKGLRESLQFWRQFNAKVKQVEKNIEDLGALEKFCDSADSRSVEILHLEHAGHAAQIETSLEILAPAQAELDDLEERLDSLRGEIARLDAEHNARLNELHQREADLKAQDVTQKIENLEHRRGALLRDRRDTEKRLNDKRNAANALGDLDACKPFVPEPLLAAAMSLIASTRFGDTLESVDWLANPEAVDSKFTSALASAKTALSSVTEKVDAIRTQVYPMRNEISVVQEKIRGLGKGMSPVGRNTQGLRALLADNGIQSHLLCDVVSIKDESWRDTIEAILGSRREAIIVHPDWAKKAVKLYRREGASFRKTHIVNTAKSGEWAGLCQKGSLAELIETDDPHARAFINLRLGNIIRVETEEELLGHRRAATTDMMFVSGGTATRLDRVDPVLGWKRQAQIKQSLENRLEKSCAELERLETTRTRAERGMSVISTFVSFANGADDSFTSLAGKLSEIDEKVGGINKEIALLSRREDAALKQAIEDLRTLCASLKSRQDDARKEEFNSGVRAGELNSIIERENAVVESNNLIIERFISERGTDPSKVADMLVKIRDQKPGEPYETIVLEILQRQKRAESSLRGLASKVGEGLVEFLAHYSGHATRLAEGSLKLDTYEDKSAFIRAEKTMLIDTELANYRERAERALAEVESTFRFSFVGRLVEKVEKMHATIDALNSILKNKPFHGETFKFRKTPTPDLRPILDYAFAAHENPAEQGLGGLFDPGNGADSPHRAAIDLINCAFQDEHEAKRIQDYRNYYVFNVDIHDEHGNFIGDLNHRIDKGSGGENMSPFYVAVGSSLSSAYGIKRLASRSFTGGMCLAPFDEAFSKLDQENCTNCFDFLKEVGLQALLAAPDEKYPIVYEHVDTLVWVNRIGADIDIDIEHPTERSRQMLSQDNPAYNKQQQIIKQLGSPITGGNVDKTAGPTEATSAAI